MSHICTICKNHNNSQCFLRLYQDTYEEICKKTLSNQKIDFSYVHPTCASFFPQTELVILNSATNPSLLSPGEKSITTESIVCNYKSITVNDQDKCMICYSHVDNEVLIPCLARDCCLKFHLPCIMNRTDIQKIKLEKKDGVTFKYGIICPNHPQGLGLDLETESYSFFKLLDESQIIEELQGYEEMLMKICSIIDGDSEIHKVYEMCSQNNLFSKQNEIKKKAKEKRQRRKAAPKSTGNSQDPAKAQEGSTNKPTQDPSKPRKEKKDLHLTGLGGPLKRGKDGIFAFRFRTRNRPEENKDNKEGGTASKGSNKKRDRSRKKSIDPNQVLQAPDSVKSLKSGIESDPNHQQKEGIDTGDGLVTLRKKNADSSSYNLRGEIKATSRLKYDNWVQDFSTPKKTKEKTTAGGENNRLMTTEEKKKMFWNEINETYFRKPYTDEAEFLLLSESQDTITTIKKEMEAIPNEAMSEEFTAAFNPDFETAELRSFTLPDFFPSTFNPRDSLKVLFEFNNSNTDIANKQRAGFIGYFRMKKKAQTEMPVPENSSEIDTSTDPKYRAIPSRQHQELKNAAINSLRPYVYKSKYKFSDQCMDSQDLSGEGYHKLFGLKHVEPLLPEDVLDIKAKTMLRQELDQMEEEKNLNESLDDIRKEMVYFTYLLNNFTVPENNVRREKFTYRMKEDYAFPKTGKLQERTKKLESELKLTATKKYFHNGFGERTNNTLTRTYWRSAPEQIISGLTIIPKNDDEEDSKIIRISRQTKPSEMVETDCCICFSNQFTESNPIIYCSSCNTSLHKYCYGIPEIPNEDFYCDICLATGDAAARKSKASANAKSRKSSFRAKLTHTDKDMRCHLCSIDEFPLKRFKKNEWYHVTCLFLHDMLQFKNGEWLIKPEKASFIEQAKSENAQQVECAICKVKTGIVDKCTAPDCAKHFHVLCAYLQGYEIDLIECDEAKDDKTKNGLNAHIYCSEHIRNPDRNIIQQQYYRRYTTNYKNTLSHETLEEYIKHLNEEEDTSQMTTQVEEFSASSKINEIVNGNELINGSIEKREPEVATEDLDTQFLSGTAKKTKVG